MSTLHARAAGTAPARDAQLWTSPRATQALLAKELGPPGEDLGLAAGGLLPRGLHE
jgi:hypothetical protein